MAEFFNRQWRLPNNENKDKQSNYSMDFDGTGTVYITAGDSNSLSGPYNGYTISAWAKTPASWESDYNAIFTKKNSFYFGLNSSHKLVLNAGSGTVWGSEITSATALSLNTWYHFLVTADGTNVKLYINGILDKTQAITNTAQNSNTSNTPYIGGYSNSSDFDTWKGQLDAVCFFDYALSQSQITTLYGSSSTGIGNPMSLSPKPVAYYPLGDQDVYNGASYLVPNAAVVGGYSPYALDFDGTNYIDCGDVPLEGVYTISFWINPDATPSALYFLLDKGDGGSNISARVSQSSNNTVRFQIDSTNFSSTDTLTNNSWNNVILIANGSSSKIYINNGTAATGTLATAPNRTESFFIATDNAQQSAYSFNGSISNVSVWNTALTSAQVTELYNSGVPSNLNNHSAVSSLVSFWQLGSNSSFNSNSWTVLDEKGTNDGVSSTNMSEVDIVNGVGYTSNGVSSGMSDNLKGSAPYSTANSLSINMDVLDRSTDIPN